MSYLIWSAEAANDDLVEDLSTARRTLRNAKCKIVKCTFCDGCMCGTNTQTNARTLQHHLHTERICTACLNCYSWKVGINLLPLWSSRKVSQDETRFPTKTKLNHGLVSTIRPRLGQGYVQKLQFFFLHFGWNSFTLIAHITCITC